MVKFASVVGEENVRNIAQLLDTLLEEPGQPRLTWYGTDGERIELSGYVIVNWVNKSTNLLVSEFDAEPGTQIALDLPSHWRTIIWALAAWRAGAMVVLSNSNATSRASTTILDNTSHPAYADFRVADADVVVTTRPTQWANTTGSLVAVTLPALARRYDGELPPGAIDAASAVMTYGDQLGWVSDTSLAEPALVVVPDDGWPGGRTTTGTEGPGSSSGDGERNGDRSIARGGDSALILATHADLVAQAAVWCPLDGPRVTEPQPAGENPRTSGATRALIRTTGVRTLLEQMLAVFSAGGSLVVAPHTAPDALANLRATERVTIDLPA